MKGMDDSLERWHRPAIKDHMIEYEDIRNKHEKLDHFLKMKQKQRQQKKKMKHGAFNIKPKMKKMTIVEQFMLLKKRKRKSYLSGNLKLIYCFVSLIET